MDGVEGVVPGVGLPIRRHGLWQGTARGISLERLLHGGLPPTALLDLLHNRWAVSLFCVTPCARTAVAGRYPFTCAVTPQVTFISAFSAALTYPSGHLWHLSISALLLLSHYSCL